MVFRIKQYDTKTAMRATILSEGNRVDLRQATDVQFLMSNSRNHIVINKPVFIIDALEGKVWFPFEESETTQTGNFKGEFVVNFNDGRRETFPNTGNIPIEIVDSNYALTKG